MANHALSIYMCIYVHIRTLYVHTYTYVLMQGNMLTYVRRYYNHACMVGIPAPIKLVSRIGNLDNNTASYVNLPP